LELNVGLEAMVGRLEGGARFLGTGTIASTAQFLIRYGVPFGGPAIGVLTAATAGYLYPVMAYALWPSDLQQVMGPSLEEGDENSPASFSWMVDAHHLFFLPVSLPVSLLAGFGMHQLLAPVLLGNVRGYSWVSVSVPLLAAVAGASAFYYTKCGVFDTRAMFWERRVDFKTGAHYSHNVKTGERAAGVGAAARSRVAGQGAALFRTLRQRWGAPAEDSTWLPADLPVHLLDRHQRLHLLVDSLVRLRYLQLEQLGALGAPVDSDDFTDDESSRNAADVFLKACACEANVKVDALLEDAQLAIVSDTRARELAKKGDLKGAKDLHRFKQGILEKIKDGGKYLVDRGATEGSAELKLLASHMNELKQRLKNDIGEKPHKETEVGPCPATRLVSSPQAFAGEARAAYAGLRHGVVAAVALQHWYASLRGRLHRRYLDFHVAKPRTQKHFKSSAWYPDSF
jgi:hypothetical protein